MLINFFILDCQSDNNEFNGNSFVANNKHNSSIPSEE